MTGDQIVILAILAATMGLFLWGRWRHDMVALAALLACVAAGLVPSGEAFAGFSHPAVITVACVLVLSSALQTTGAIDALSRVILPRKAGPLVTIGTLAGLAAVLSGFMNNVGAMALLMPVAVQAAARVGLPPGRVLMPLAYGSILGGMTTLIGTPPNLIVSSFRDRNGAGSFAMFDFTPVGLAVALAGVAFIVGIGWRLVPLRERRGVEGFDAGAYLTEARVPDGAKAAGMTLRDVEAALAEIEAQVVGLIRSDKRIPAPNPYREVRPGDILVIEAEPDALANALSSLGLELEEDVRRKEQEEEDQEEEDVRRREEEEVEELEEERAGPQRPDADRRRRGPLQSDDVVLMELAVRPRAEISGRSARDIRLRAQFGTVLLALSRGGRRSMARLASTPIREGDVLLVQGPPERISEFAARYGCVPLAERPLRIPAPAKALTASGIMAAAVAGAAFGLAPAAIAFAAGLLALVLLRVVPARRIYDAVDWSVVVLLAALIPVAGAMSSTGTADVIAGVLMQHVAGDNAVVLLVLMLVGAMVLSDFMNNAATAAVMCPIALGAAAALGVNADAFLMAVAVGASCAFLTPIGHQNNTLILGPGGFRFGDYWPLGLPLEIVVLAVGVPMILFVWPL